jgi:DNA-binding CsgD family transcriptional regulator
MYDVSPDFLHQLTADRRASLQRTGAASSASAPLRGAVAAFIARLRGAPVEDSAAPAAPVATHPLTRREHEVLMLVAEGLTNAQIAERLWISPGTVRRHLQNAFPKLGVHTRTAAAARLRNG